MKRNNGFKTLIVWLIIGIIIIFVVPSIINSTNNTLTYSELIDKIEKNEVTDIEISYDGESATVKLKGDNSVKNVNIPNVENLLENLNSSMKTNSINVTSAEEPFLNIVADLLVPISSIILILMLLMLFSGGSQNQGANGALSFGKSRARMINSNSKSKVTFADVAGIDEEKEELEEVVDFLKNPKKFTDMGARIPKGVLLVGQPGTGKTLLAKAVAGEAGVPFFFISGSDDEIDAVGRQRGAGLGGGHDEREQTLNQLLVEMDGFTANEGVIVIAATNRPDVLDKALLRPGRFDRQIVVPAPDVKAREQILEVHSKKKKFEDDVDLKLIAKNTSGFTGADLENLLNEAALLAARRNKTAIGQREIEDAMVKVTMGPEKKSRVRNDKEKRLTAYHEAGHAVVSKFLPTQDPVHEISIIPRGMAGGYTMYRPTEDKSFISKTEMLENIVSLLGGRVSEQIVLGDISTGASNDIQRATQIAKAMCTKYGMSDRIGTITLGTDQDEVFLGRDLAQSKPYSEETAGIIDEEIKRIIDWAYKRATDILEANRDKLDKVAAVLIEKEKITGDEFDRIFEE